MIQRRYDTSNMSPANVERLLAGLPLVPDIWAAKVFGMQKLDLRQKRDWAMVVYKVEQRRGIKAAVAAFLDRIAGRL